MGVRVQQAVLVGVCLCYLAAFASFYIQAPGLYGYDGILPVQSYINQNTVVGNKARAASSGWLLHRLSLVVAEAGSSLPAPADGWVRAAASSIDDADKWLMQWPAMQRFSQLPSLVAALPEALNIHPDHALDLVAAMGMVLSALAISFRGVRIKLTMLALWFFYSSLYHVGQTFLHFQWDILLLEVGLLAVVLAPWTKQPGTRGKPGSDAIMGTFAMRWLVFRLMFLSGVVKLTSGCPTWWGLTALNVHYESQCIPSPLAWYFHHFPAWFHSFSVVAVYVIEIAMPFFFFGPLRIMRIVASLSQIVLMVLIFTTGNYNFFNILTAVIALAVLDDAALGMFMPWLRNHSRSHVSSADGGGSVADAPPAPRRRSPFFISAYVDLVLSLLCLLALLVATVFAFNITVEPAHAKSRGAFPFVIKSSINFSEKAFDGFVHLATIAGSVLGAAALLGAAAKSLERAVWSNRPSLARVVSSLLHISIVVLLFAASLEPLSWNDPKAKQYTSHPDWGYVTAAYRSVSRLDSVHTYGLFRRMTGVGGRPEVNVEYSYDGDTWHEYRFKYKPDDPKKMPPFNAPHQPRLDWQMWFAALGSIQHNPWLSHFAMRLLEQSPSVLRLLDAKQDHLLADQAPKFVRMTKYLYHYTNSTSAKAWWTREKASNHEYVFPVSLDTHKDVVKNFRTHMFGTTTFPAPDDHPGAKSIIGIILSSLRNTANQVDDMAFMITVLALPLIVLIAF